MLIRLKRAQSVTEYAILLGIVIAAFAGMQVYLKRGLQARVKSGTDAFTSPATTIDVNGFTTDFLALSQYEPYYAESKGENYSENVKQEHMGGGKIVEEIVSEIGASASDGYRAELAGAAAQGAGGESIRT